MPIYEFPRGTAPLVVDVVVTLGLAASRGEAKRLIEQGGLRLNDAAVSSLTATIGGTDMDATGTARLSAGKKRHALVKAV